METKSLDQLTPNSKNPRTITRHDYDALKQSITKFGDLSGIVFNLTTHQLVGGHMRVQAFKELGGVPTIVERYEQPNSKGTIATGYVLLDDEKYTYREVQWNNEIELAANIAANRIEGNWNQDMLAEINHELAQLENGIELLALTGQHEDELLRLNKLIGVVDEPLANVDPDAPENNKLEFALTREQREIVEEALGNIKANRDMATEQNSSQNGNALYYMSRDYLDRLHGLTENQAPPTAQ